MDPSNVTPIGSRTPVRLEMSGHVCVVAVTGEVDLSVVAPVAQALQTAIRESDAVLVDLCDCTFIDSSGLSVLLEASRTAKRHGKRFGVACTPGTPPRTLFDLVFGHGLFESSDDRASGLAALGDAV